MTRIVAIIAALAAGGSFAAAGVLQQRAASTRPENEALSFRLILDLAHDPLWLLGIGFAFLSYVLEALALSYGPLVLVQPLVVSELLFALPISIRWRGMQMSARTWFGTVSVALGLAVGLAVFAVGAGQRREGALRSSLYAIGAALVLGTQAALMKATIARFEHGLVDAVSPSVAITLGIALFHEHIRTGLWLPGIAAGLAMLFGGIWLLDTSPQIQCLQRVEHPQRTDAAPARHTA
jgi:drug/metabolite transporter (DMT)-like permease